MIRSFRSRALRRFWERGDVSGLRPDWSRKVELFLDALDVAKRPEDMDMLGAGFHRLVGKRAGRYAVAVSRNWRITFAFDGEDAIDVDLEDYHGK